MVVAVVDVLGGGDEAHAGPIVAVFHPVFGDGAVAVGRRFDNLVVANEHCDMGPPLHKQVARKELRLLDWYELVIHCGGAGDVFQVDASLLEHPVDQPGAVVSDPARALVVVALFRTTRGAYEVAPGDAAKPLAAARTDVDGLDLARKLGEAEVDRILRDLRGPDRKLVAIDILRWIGANAPCHAQGVE